MLWTTIWMPNRIPRTRQTLTYLSLNSKKKWKSAKVSSKPIRTYVYQTWNWKWMLQIMPKYYLPCSIILYLLSDWIFSRSQQIFKFRSWPHPHHSHESWCIWFAVWCWQYACWQHFTSKYQERNFPLFVISNSFPYLLNFVVWPFILCFSELTNMLVFGAREQAATVAENLKQRMAASQALESTYRLPWLELELWSIFSKKLWFFFLNVYSSQCGFLNFNSHGGTDFEMITASKILPVKTLRTSWLKFASIHEHADACQNGNPARERHKTKKPITRNQNRAGSITLRSQKICRWPVTPPHHFLPFWLGEIWNLCATRYKFL